MTSYHDVNIVSTIDKLEKVKGVHLCYIGLDEVDEKSQVDFSVMVDGEPLGYIYSWKEYRELSRYEQIDFHIGARDWYTSMRLKEYVEGELKNIA